MTSTIIKLSDVCRICYKCECIDHEYYEIMNEVCHHCYTECIRNNPNYCHCFPCLVGEYCSRGFGEMIEQRDNENNISPE